MPFSLLLGRNNVSPAYVTLKSLEPQAWIRIGVDPRYCELCMFRDSRSVLDHIVEYPGSVGLLPRDHWRALRNQFFLTRISTLRAGGITLVEVCVPD